MDPCTLQPGRRIALRGERWTVLASTKHVDCVSLRVSGAGGENVAAVRTFLLPFDRPRDSVGRARPRVVTPRRWRHDVRQMFVSCQPPGSITAAGRASVDLLPFQLEPAIATLWKGQLRLLIADEVGLGKTVQAGMILAQLASGDTDVRALVVTPAGLRGQWRDELEARFGLASTFADAAWLSDMARSLPPSVNPWSLPGLFITSIDFVKRPEVLRALEDVTWDACVIDEAHGLGSATARLAAAHALAQRARRVLLLTATPPYGEPPAMKALSSVGQLHPHDHLTIFRRTRRDAGVAARRRSVLFPVRLGASERRLCRALERYASAVWRQCERRGDTCGRLAVMVLRKRALSSAASLALSLRRRAFLLSVTSDADAGEGRQLPLPLADEDQLPDAVPDSILGAQGLEDRTQEREWLLRLVTLAEHAGGESKVRFLRRFLRRVHEPVLVFTEYRDTLVHLAGCLGDSRPLLLHGGLTPLERERVQRAFAGSGSLLLATDAASEGLNLHARCRIVVHFELPWTPMRLEQRTGRVDRLGQSRDVHEILMVARHTSERLVLAPLLARCRQAVAAGDPVHAAALTESRVAELLAGTAATQPEHVPRQWTATRLASEAQAEVDRLAKVRRLSRRVRSTRGGGIIPVAWSRTSPKQPAVVVRLALEDADGRVLSSELLVLRVELSCGADAVHHFDPLTLTSALVPGDAIGAAVERHVAALRPNWCSAATSGQQALARREEWMLAAVPSVAAQLVQVGLFDRRMLIDAERRARITAARRAEAERRLAALRAAATCHARIEVVAVDFGGGLLR